MKSTARFCVACLLAAALHGSPQAWAQIPGVPAAGAPAAAATQPEAPKDPLGRDTPRGTVLGFMEAARENKTDVIPLYLNSGLRGDAATELAQQLYVVLNSRLPVRVNALSDRPDGSLVNPLKPNEDAVGTINTARGPLDLVVERVNTNGVRVWLFSRATLQAIPGVYSEIDLVTVDGYLPEFLARPRIAGIRLLDWLVLVFGIPLCYRLLGLLGPLLRPLYAMARRLLHKPEGPALEIHGSIRLLILAAGIRWFVLNIDLPLVERQLWAVIRVALLISGLVWLALLFNDFGERYARQRVQASHLGESIALLRLARRVADVLVICVGGIAALAYLGIDATAALAGLGIGGIAVALAAQKTLENVIGGFSLVFDKAVRVGDFLKLGETLGTVDRVGLRSTRIRTLDRTMLSVPNGQVATANIETFSDRDKFWFRHIIGLRYETTPAQMRLIVARVHELLAGQTGVEAETVRARFFRLGPSTLDVEVVAYIFAIDWSRFLEIQQELLLHIMEIVEEAGTSIAFPSQTLHLRDDRGPTRLSPPMGAGLGRLTRSHDEDVETV
jgi:MscS family membrane protein